MARDPRPDRQVTRALPVRQYTLLCLVALLLMLMVLLEKGLGEWALLPVAIGCVALLLNVRGGPAMMLVLLVFLVLSYNSRGGLDPFDWVRELRFHGRLPEVQLPGGTDTRKLPLTDMVLCAAYLVYALGFYRVQSMVQQVFPVDPRRKNLARALAVELRHKHGPAAQTPSPREKRSVERVDPRELPWLVWTALVWAVLAWLLWALVTALPQPGRIPRAEAPVFSVESWRLLVLVWLFGGGLVLLTAVLAYLDQSGAGTEANQVYLQDQLWRETRHEQSRLNRWLVGARLRRQRKESK